jgi:hypothetical protein
MTAESFEWFVQSKCWQVSMSLTGSRFLSDPALQGSLSQCQFQRAVVSTDVPMSDLLP